MAIASPVPGGDYDTYVDAHVRRLEALRRAGIVERLEVGDGGNRKGISWERLTPGYVGEHIEQYQANRETRTAEQSVAMERLARLRGERKTINETRPPAAILAAMAGARRSEQPTLQKALAMARRRDDLELAAFEKRLPEIPQVATTHASAAVLREIGRLQG